MRGALALTALLLGGCVASDPPRALPPPPAEAAAPGANPPAGMQYLYGSGEGAAISMQAWRALVGHAIARATARPKDSVVLAAGSTLDAPTFAPCGDKPFAAVFDVDETVMLNTGFEYQDAKSGKGYSQATWDAWERTGIGAVEPVPGAVEALHDLRAMNIAVIFNTNRSAANAGATAQAIKAAGLGEALHGVTLYLQGDDASGSKKDGRRATIASKYCVIAMGGDQLGDFSDLFNIAQPVSARRAATMEGAIAHLWGNGWFVLPNPVYGTALKGSYDDVFSSEKRWAPDGK